MSDGDPHGLLARRAALAIVAAVLDEGRTLDAARTGAPVAALAGPGRARAGDLAAAVLRWVRPIDALLATLIAKPVPARARVARDALRLAVAEVAVLGTAPHAAVDAAVRLTKADRRSGSLAGLVNAVARAAVLAAPGYLATAGARAATAPDWLARRLRAAWGRHVAAEILSAHLCDAPTDLSLRDAGETALWAARLGAGALPTGSLRLGAAPPQITTAPGYDAGAWWVQDAAAAIPARLLGDVAGRRVLDLCAAPGGKTLQLAARGARVTALDVAEGRLKRLRENLARTGLGAEIIAADALEWHPEVRFDAVLLDAPCSATGTIRRHPDLPHLRREADIAVLAAVQDRLLEAAWTMLAPAGLLVFSTCSLLPQEGEDRAAAFLARHPDARRVAVLAAETGDAALVSAAGDLRTRPDMWADRGGLDGFFAARFAKSG